MMGRVGHVEPSVAESVGEAEAPPDNEVIAPTREPLPAVIDQLLLFGASPAAASGRKRATRRPSSQLSPVDQQLGLF
jgi:hypothetical protein